jgi:hypothetical protein
MVPLTCCYVFGGGMVPLACCLCCFSFLKMRKFVLHNNDTTSETCLNLTLNKTDSHINQNLN